MIQVRLPLPTSLIDKEAWSMKSLEYSPNVLRHSLSSSLLCHSRRVAVKGEGHGCAGDLALAMVSRFNRLNFFDAGLHPTHLLRGRGLHGGAARWRHFQPSLLLQPVMLLQNIKPVQGRGRR